MNAGRVIFGFVIIWAATVGFACFVAVGSFRGHDTCGANAVLVRPVYGPRVCVLTQEKP